MWYSLFLMFSHFTGLMIINWIVMSWFHKIDFIGTAKKIDNILCTLCTGKCECWAYILWLLVWGHFVRSFFSFFSWHPLFCFVSLPKEKANPYRLDYKQCGTLKIECSTKISIHFYIYLLILHKIGCIFLSFLWNVPTWSRNLDHNKYWSNIADGDFSNWTEWNAMYLLWCKWFGRHTNGKKKKKKKKQL